MNFVLVCHNLESLPARFLGDWRTLEFRFDLDLRNEGKWKNMQCLLHTEPACGRGEYFWFPDPDLEFAEGLPGQLFAEMKRLNLDLAQPCLTRNSVCSHPFHLQRNGPPARRVAFCEIMMPCFSAAGLRRNLWTFGLNYSGFGIDLLWGSKEKCYVLDRLPVCHPWSPGYQHTARAAGFPDPHRELGRVQREYL